MRGRLATVALVVALGLSSAGVVGADSATHGVVNVNTASSEQLQLLPKIGPALAERIIAFRETNGPFKKVDELVAVRGIGEKSLAVLRPYVVTDGRTTLTQKIRLPKPTTSASGG
jgi:competence protein ComEA